VPNTVLEAIKLGLWDFEPREMDSEEFEACCAMPGTPDKLTALAERVRLGLPLWHPADRNDCEDPSPLLAVCEPVETIGHHVHGGRRPARPKRRRPARTALLGSPG
jgi:hypothetical protein